MHIVLRIIFQCGFEFNRFVSIEGHQRANLHIKKIIFFDQNKEVDGILILFI